MAPQADPTPQDTAASASPDDATQTGIQTEADSGSRSLASTDSSPSTAPNGKSRKVTAWLALLLGGFGAHKFYLGQTGMGFLYLALCWTFVPTLIAFIEFTIFLTMKDALFNRKYGSL